MKLFRFMSAREFQLYNAGVEILPIRRKRKFRTTGKGIFFLPERYLDTERDTDKSLADYKETPEAALAFLSGIVSNDQILVEFVADDDIPYEMATGIYASPFDYDWYATIMVDEICLSSYSIDTLTATRYWIPNLYGRGGISHDSSLHHLLRLISGNNSQMGQGSILIL